jgi:RNA polymerase sigma-70 factor (ECF subfamily)
MSIATTETRPAARPLRAPRKDTSSDEALIGRIAKGDKTAIRILFARHQVRVYRFVVRMVGDPMVAEDLVNETFLEAWRQAARFEARSTVSTWLLAIARFKALSVRRRRMLEEVDLEMAVGVVDPNDTPEMSMNRKDASEILRKCLNALPGFQAEVINLVYYHEKSIKEVSEIVGVPENTVKTRMFGARKRLAAMLEAAGIDRSTLWLAAA